MALQFEWDDTKATANLRKHVVSFDEASTVFDDELARIFLDEDHSTVEAREIIVGYSIAKRLLVVSFLETAKDTLRILTPERRPEKSVGSMKKTSKAKPQRARSNELRSEYDFDYSKAAPNRFAGRARLGRTIVVLDPDISEVFTTPDSVRKALRAIISAMPRATKTKSVRKSS